MRRLTIVVVALLTTLLAATPALAVDDVNTKRLRNAVTVGGILAHERVLPADRQPATAAPAPRARPGYDASADYVAQPPAQAPATRSREQEFDFPFFRELAPADADADLADADRLRDRHASTTPAAATSPARSCRPTTS